MQNALPRVVMIQHEVARLGISGTEFIRWPGKHRGGTASALIAAVILFCAALAAPLRRIFTLAFIFVLIFAIAVAVVRVFRYRCGFRWRI